MSCSPPSRAGRQTCRFFLAISLAAAVICTALTLAGCIKDAPDDGKIHLTYWEKWQRFEGEAMQRVVDAFNASQDRIVVHMTLVSQIERKVLTATAGGNSPDLAGLWDNQVAAFSEQGILTPLDDYMKRDGITRDHWIPVYADICTHMGVMWCVPTTPATLGLHWNKALFRASADELRAAGLDPGRAPKTLEELNKYCEILTKFDEDGNIIQMGFLPQEPGWFHWAWGSWFGGTLIDEDGNITANHPRNVEAFEWIQSFALKYGTDKIYRFASGFGNFSSPQNPFFSGRVAMVIQGVWMHNYISQYAPGMQYGVAPWPKTPNGPADFSVASCDILTIPAGVPKERRDAAWEFVKFVLSPFGMETLNLGQRKNTPLNEVSEGFIEEHPHPHIELFIQMSRYEHCTPPARVGVWTEYMKEWYFAFEKMRVLSRNPATNKPYTAAEALDEMQARISLSHKRQKESLALRPAIAGGRP